jgi:hypothetical protein
MDFSQIMSMLGQSMSGGDEDELTKLKKLMAGNEMAPSGPSPIQALLGQAQPQVGGQAPGRTPPIAPDPTQDTQGPDLGVSGKAFDKPDVHEGLLGGTFKVGHTGGNILGILGDALLVGSGGDPVYAHRVKQAREAEALRNYSTDPIRALQQYNEIDAPAALKGFNDREDNLRQEEAARALEKNRQDAYEGNTHTRAGALLGAATPKTYDAIKKRYNEYYATRGVQPLVDLPDTYDEALISGLRTSFVPPTQQIKLEDTRDYRGQVLSQRDRFEEGRNNRNHENNGVRVSEGTANRKVRVQEGSANRSVKVTEGAANRGSREKIAAMPSRGRARPPVVKWGVRPDGTRYPIQ